jgi:hypothetical protein
VLKRKWLRGKGTTTNRRSTKSSPTFCVFLLTENILPLILRIQIRGTWKRQADRVGDGSRSVCGHEAAQFLKRKNRARDTSSAPVLEAEHLLLG